MLKNPLILLSLLILLSSCSKYGHEFKDVHNSNNNLKTDNNNNDLIVTINNEQFNKEHVDLYATINKIYVELRRAEDEEGNKGQLSTERTSFWDDQLKQYDNINVNLDSIIELNAMALLAEEKGYYIKTEHVNEQFEFIKKKITTNTNLSKYIEHYNSEQFDLFFKKYINLNLLKGKVIEDLRTSIENDQQKLSDKEVEYTLNKQYEQLYVEQIRSLEIKIHIN